MASTISSSNSSLPTSWLSETSSTTLRDVSFSSYLNGSEEAYVRTIAQSGRNFNHNQHHSPYSKGTERNHREEEIDVFSADKYFNGSMQEHNTRTKHQQHVINGIGVDHSTLKKVTPRTPSTHSESSWNSQSALIRRVQRTPSRRSNNSNNSKSQGKRFLACSCCDKSSVEVESESEFIGGSKREEVITRSIKTSFQVADITRLNKLRLNNHTDPFAFPVQVNDHQEEKAAKKSLEVFGVDDLDDDNVGSNRFSLEKKLNMLSWDAIPSSNTKTIIDDREEMNTTTSISGRPSGSYKEDSDSDASSDLFEIECLSCTANPVMGGLRRASTTDFGCSTPTTGYAPSEASIDWSVVTASAADFSVMSYAESRPEITRPRPKMALRTASSPKMVTNKDIPKPRPGIHLGCKSQKAVRVAGDAYRTPIAKREKLPSDRKPRYSDSLLPLTRFQAEVKLAPRSSPRWSHSSNTSDLLYVQ